jgi:hypothetical protein
MITIMTMKNNLKSYLLLALFIATSLISCSESEGNDDIESSVELSEIVMQDFSSTINEIQLPTSLVQSSNQYASQVNLQMQLFKGLTAAFSSLFTVPENAIAAKGSSKLLSKSATTQTYTWSAQGITFNYKITEESDRYTFAYDIVSQEYTGSYLNGYQLKDGSLAEINFLGTGEESLKLKWTNLDNIAKMEMDVDDTKLVLESNLNSNAGNMKIYEEGKLTSTFIWNADGSGTYTDHLENQTFTF